MYNERRSEQQTLQAFTTSSSFGRLTACALHPRRASTSGTPLRLPLTPSLSSNACWLLGREGPGACQEFAPGPCPEPIGSDAPRGGRIGTAQEGKEAMRRGAVASALLRKDRKRCAAGRPHRDPLYRIEATRRRARFCRWTNP
jgi:hypothetical protein